VGKKKAAARGGPNLAAHIWCCLGLGSLAEPNFPQDQKKKRPSSLTCCTTFRMKPSLKAQFRGGKDLGPCDFCSFFKKKKEKAISVLKPKKKSSMQ
jgi:hypothetical protein